MRVLRPLYAQVIVAILLAVMLGVVAPAVAVTMKPLGDLFIALLRMLLGPIIFCSVVLGLTHIADMRQLGRLAGKALLYFEVLTTLGMLVGFAAVNIFRPGDGLHARALALTPGIAKLTSGSGDFTLTHFILSIVPGTLVSAFSEGQILQILLVSVLVGAALNLTGKGSESRLIGLIAELQQVLFRILGFFMRLAPLGAFGAMAAAVGMFGAVTLVYLAKLVALYWLTTIVFVLVVLGAIGWWIGISLFKVLRLVREELVIVLGTASGEVVLPRLIMKLEQAGCDEAVVGFVLPAGYSFNLDGTSIYMAIAVGFIAQATDTPFDWAQQAAVLGVLLLTSKGGTTVAGGAFVKLAATLQTVKTLPLAGLNLLFGVDRLMSTCVALSNVIGNTMAVFAIARWERAFDRAAFDAFLLEQSAGRTGTVDRGIEQ